MDRQGFTPLLIAIIVVSALVLAGGAYMAYRTYTRREAGGSGQTSATPQNQNASLSNSPAGSSSASTFNDGYMYHLRLNDSQQSPVANNLVHLPQNTFTRNTSILVRVFAAQPFCNNHTDIHLTVRKPDGTVIKGVSARSSASYVPGAHGGSLCFPEAVAVFSGWGIIADELGTYTISSTDPTVKGLSFSVVPFPASAEQYLVTNAHGFVLFMEAGTLDKARGEIVSATYHAGDQLRIARAIIFASFTIGFDKFNFTKYDGQVIELENWKSGGPTSHASWPSGRMSIDLSVTGTNADLTHNDRALLDAYLKKYPSSLR